MFIPPHCVNPECDNYRNPKQRDWFSKIGSYPTHTFGRVPRFKCKECLKSFSAQTFSIDYYVKRTIDYPTIHHEIHAGSGIRKLARRLRVSPNAVINRIRRLTRLGALPQSSSQPSVQD